MAHDILIVDDEADIRMLIAGVLRDEGYATREAGDSRAAIAAVRARRPNLVILDIWLQGSELDGMGILDVLRREHPGLPVLMISGHGTIETAVSAIKLGAYDFVEKPFKTDRLLVLIERAIEAARLRRENEELRLRTGGSFELVGASSAIGQIRQAIERVSPTGSRVLVTGPPVPARRWWPASSTTSRAAPTARSSSSTARRCGQSGWRSSCSARKGPMARTAAARSAPSSWPTAVRCSSTRSPTCRWRPRARSSAPSRTRPSSASAAPAGSRSMSASSRRPTAT